MPVTKARSGEQVETESDRVRMWRITEAREITGCTLKLAVEFAEGDGDLHRLADLVGNGCDGLLALQIA